MDWLDSLLRSLQGTILDVAPILVILLVFQVLVLRQRPHHRLIHLLCAPNSMDCDWGRWRRVRRKR